MTEYSPVLTEGCPTRRRTRPSRPRSGLVRTLGSFPLGCGVGVGCTDDGVGPEDPTGTKSRGHILVLPDRVSIGPRSKIRAERVTRGYAGVCSVEGRDPES